MTWLRLQVGHSGFCQNSLLGQEGNERGPQKVGLTVLARQDGGWAKVVAMVVVKPSTV